jgi:hypothetical protein
MRDRELEFVSMLIDEYRQAARFFFVFSCAFIVAGMSTLVWLLANRQYEKIFMDALSGIMFLFGAIPVFPYLGARSSGIYFGSLRACWQDARAENDLQGLQKLKDDFAEIRKGTLSKPFWSLK